MKNSLLLFSLWILLCGLFSNMKVLFIQYMVGFFLQWGVLSNLLGFPWEICRDYTALLWFIISTLFLTHKACIILCLPSATDRRKFHHQSKRFKIRRSGDVTKAQSATVVIGGSFIASLCRNTSHFIAFPRIRFMSL